MKIWKAKKYGVLKKQASLELKKKKTQTCMIEKNIVQSSTLGRAGEKILPLPLAPLKYFGC